MMYRQYEHVSGCDKNQSRKLHSKPNETTLVSCSPVFHAGRRSLFIIQCFVILGVWLPGIGTAQIINKKRGVAGNNEDRCSRLKHAGREEKHM